MEVSGQLYTKGNSLCTCYIGGSVGPRPCLNVVEKREISCLCWGLKPGHRAYSPSVYQLRYLSLISRTIPLQYFLACFPYFQKIKGVLWDPFIVRLPVSPPPPNFFIIYVDCAISKESRNSGLPRASCFTWKTRDEQHSHRGLLGSL
jgi:hypothetical protein